MSDLTNEKREDAHKDKVRHLPPMTASCDQSFKFLENERAMKPAYWYYLYTSEELRNIAFPGNTG